MDALEKAELTVSIRHIARFLKSWIPIYNSEFPDTTGRKTRRRRRIKTQTITERFAFNANATIFPYLIIFFLEAATGGVLQKKVLLKILQYSLENTCVGVSF